MKNFLLRHYVASLLIAFSFLFHLGCEDDCAMPNEPEPPLPVLPMPALNCGTDVKLRCYGSFTIPAGGAAGLSLTSQCLVPNNFLDSLLANSLWVDDVNQIYAMASSIVSIGTESYEYDCGSSESYSTCTGYTPISLPALTSVKLMLINPANPLQKMVLGQWVAGINTTLEQFALDGTDMASYFYPQPPLDQFVLEVEVQLAEPVLKTCPVQVSLGFCVHRV